jgi:hypothetical protein
MRIEILLLIITGGIIYNIYTEGKFIRKLYSFKKYYQMIGVVFAALMLYILLKKNPLRAKNILDTSNEYLKYLPIDKNTSDMISPILNFSKNYTSSTDDYQSLDGDRPIIQMNQGGANEMGGNRKHKRSVSESRKKFVASRQQWKCASCGEMLTASFEIDHIKRLEFGGDNSVDNLTAMCRNCHGMKTTMENL